MTIKIATTIPKIGEQFGAEGWISQAHTLFNTSPPHCKLAPECHWPDQNLLLCSSHIHVLFYPTPPKPRTFDQWPHSAEHQTDIIERGHPFMTSALKKGGGVRELADFADKQYWSVAWNADRGGRGDPKSQKFCGHHKWMAPERGERERTNSQWLILFAGAINHLENKLACSSLSKATQIWWREQTWSQCWAWE